MKYVTCHYNKNYNKILIKMKRFFLISKDFIMNMDRFLISILFSVFFFKFNKHIGQLGIILVIMATG